MPRQSLVVGGDGAGFAAGAQILAGIEAERCGVSHRPGLAPAGFLLREILRAVRLAGILDEDEVVPSRQLEERVHVGDLPIQMHRNDGRHRAASALAHHPTRPPVGGALGLQVDSQLLGIHRVGARIDIDEIRPRADLRDRFRRRDEGERHRHDGVSGLDARRDQGEAQRVRAAGDSNAHLRLAELRKVALEFLHHGAADEPGSVEGGLEDGPQLFAELAVHRDKLEKRNLTRAHAAPSSREMCP